MRGTDGYLRDRYGDVLTQEHERQNATVASLISCFVPCIGGLPSSWIIMGLPMCVGRAGCSLYNGWFAAWLPAAIWNFGVVLLMIIVATTFQLGGLFALAAIFAIGAIGCCIVGILSLTKIRELPSAAVVPGVVVQYIPAHPGAPGYGLHGEYPEQKIDGRFVQAPPVQPYPPPGPQVAPQAWQPPPPHAGGPPNGSHFIPAGSFVTPGGPVVVHAQYPAQAQPAVALYPPQPPLGVAPVGGATVTADVQVGTVGVPATGSEWTAVPRDGPKTVEVGEFEV